MGLRFALLLSLLLAGFAPGVLGAKRRVAKVKRELLADTGPSDEQIWETGLGAQDVDLEVICMI